MCVATILSKNVSRAMTSQSSHTKINFSRLPSHRLIFLRIKQIMQIHPDCLMRSVFTHPTRRDPLNMLDTFAEIYITRNLWLLGYFALPFQLQLQSEIR
jgi:hypothetical protein